jgi:hypothetical protein
MSEQETLPTNVHAEAALLPWFANNTLSEADRRLVTLHLETCHSCRRELSELIQIRTQLAAFYAAEPKPSPRTAQSVLDRIAQEASPQQTATTSREPWLHRLDNWVRLRFASRWAPSLALLVLLVQFGLLLWATIPPVQPEQVTPRSLPSPSVRFRVTFQEQASEEQIRSMLNNVRGRVVDGPTPNGTYLVEVLPADEETNRKKLEILRSQPNVIRSADLEKS